MLPSLLSLALCLPLVQDAPETFAVEGEHFRVVSYLEDNELGRALSEEALKVVESTWSITGELITLPDLLPELMTVNLFGTVAGYQAVEQEITGGQFKENNGFSSYGTLESYVAITPPCTDSTLKRIGLPFQAKRMLAHEATHLIVYRSFTNFRSHPDWFAEGLTCHVAAQVLMNLGEFKTMESAPFYGGRIHNVGVMIDDGKLPTHEQLMMGELGDLPRHLRYDLNAQFFAYLCEKKQLPKLKDFIGDLRRMGGGGEFASDARDAFQESFGASRIKKLDKGFRKYVGGFKPEWNEVFRSAGGRELIQIGFPSKNAILWQVKPPAKKSYELTVELEVLQGSQMNLLLDKSEGGFISIAIVAGSTPNLTIFDYNSKADVTWDRKFSGPLKPFPLGQVGTFSALVKGDQLTVLQDGETIAEVQLPGHDFSGPWGLGAQAGSGGIWKLVKRPK